MAASSSKLKSCYSIRSISLPTRSHPTTAGIEEELSKFKKWEASPTPTAKTISNDLLGLQDLYTRAQDLLELPLTQQVISRHQHARCVDELQDGLMGLLDICGRARDVISQIKEHGRDVQSSMRRTNGDSNIQSSIAKYTCFRKKIKNDAKQLIAVLKKMENKIGASPLLELDHVSSVVRSLREMELASISILLSLLSFLSVPISWPNSAIRSLVSKLLNKGAVARENKLENVKDLQSLDTAVYALSKSDSGEGDKKQVVQNGLKSFEVSIENIENGLECLFRSMIKARASLLNTVSTTI
ncbi:uncharacterized protein LOC127804322 [Diospyros lotus]|uniref:uncharacterized protein LOC127804322 n=1 Tax=Diospyros lotus TaxID=55363 RepID=UPI0022535E7B|nr:uncharacterized protein LOC127804322 [Diospyros lotus]